MALNLLLLRSPPNTNMILSNDPAYLREVDGSSTTRLGLILYLDASDPNSWKGGSTGTWYDISGGGNHISVSPTAYHNTGSIGYMDFSGPYGCAKYQVSDFVPGVNTITAVVWTQILNNTSTWRTLFHSLSTGANHQVIVQTGAYLIGMYDNDNSSAFNSSGYSQQSLPGYSTWRWNMMVWRWQGSNPYYQLSINDAPQTILGSIASSNAGWGATRGICSIGAFNNEAQSGVTNALQYWGYVSSLRMYNRVLSNGELLTIWNATKGRFAL